jgi:predicted TIM-barrel fold metal-dependent hydrolase
VTGELAGAIDSHVHIGRDSYGAIEPYRAVMDRLGLRAAVLVARQWQFNNTELLHAAAAEPDRLRVVGAVELLAPEAEAAIAHAVEAGIAGLRVDPEWLAADPHAPVWRRIADAGLVVSLAPRIDVVATDAFAAALGALDDVTVRLEHLGGIRHAKMSIGDERVLRILALAERPNVVTMWSGFWLNAGSPWPYPTADPILRESLDAFGPERICWSGDWNRPGPTIGSHISDEEYEHEVDVVHRVAGSDAVAILSGTAARLFAFHASRQPLSLPFDSR